MLPVLGVLVFEAIYSGETPRAEAFGKYSAKTAGRFLPGAPDEVVDCLPTSISPGNALLGSRPELQIRTVTAVFGQRRFSLALGHVPQLGSELVDAAPECDWV